MPLTPLSLQNFDLSDPAQGKQYQFQLMQFLNGLLSQFNTLQGQVNPLLTPATSNLGTLSGNTTFNANGALITSITFSFTVALTLTIQNLPIGAVFQMNITNTTAGTKVLTGVATTPSGASYTSWLVNAAAGQRNPLTGWSFPASTTFFVIGTTMAGPAINQLAQ